MESSLSPLAARVVGVLMVGVCSVWLSSTWRFVESGVSTYGHIVEIEAIPNVDGVFPVFEYETETGERFQDRAIGGSFVLFMYDVGERVPIIYDPNDPTNAKIDTFFGNVVISDLRSCRWLCFRGVWIT